MLTLLVRAVGLVVCGQIHGRLFVAAFAARVRLIVGEVTAVATGKFFQEVGLSVGDGRWSHLLRQINSSV